MESHFFTTFIYLFQECRFDFLYHINNLQQHLTKDKVWKGYKDFTDRFSNRFGQD